MATVEYDLDTSGGLMEEIQKLVAPPPSNDDFSRRPRRRVREYRKGRAVNHDCCDSCKEGGDLLCCDQCPAAFHLQCHDPPLEEDDLPSGEWICHRCRVGPPQEVKEESSATPTLPAPKPSTSRSRGRRKSLEEPMEVQGPEEEDVSSNPLKMLAKAARLMNPVQFDLTKDIACTTALPGSSKRRWGREGSRGPPKKLAHELDNGIVPLPAKLCFVCNKSCKKAPLIQCDYCPLLFHMDCLNPPLTSLPSGRWMCPNHAENCLDEGLLKSTSLSERVRLWDHYAPGQINQHAAKVEFLKKVHRHNPPFRIKVKHPKRKTVMVPQVIKDNYANPPALLPRPCSHVTVPGGDNWKGSPSLEDQEEWLSSVVSLQTSIAKYLAQKQLNKSPSASVGSPSLCATLSSSDVLTKPTASVSPVVHTGSEETSSTTGLKSTVSGTCVASENETVSGSVEEEERTKVNGPLNAAVGLSECDSPDSMTLPNGPVDKSTETVKTGAISLLNHTPNGDIVSWQNTEAMVVKTRSNSIDSSSLNIAKSRLSGDRSSFGGNSLSAGSPSSLIPATTASKGKNIVISAINKANNTVITKVVSGSMPQAGKPLTNSATGKAVGNSNSPTSILSPRTANSSSRTISNTQTANKVITVSTSTPGIKSSVNSSSSVSSGPSAKVSSLSSSPAIANLNSTLQSCIEGNGEMELGKLDERLVQILAWQRLQQLLPSKPQSPPSSASIPAKKGVLNGLLSHQGSCEVQARALLCPLTGKGQPISMPYRTLNIGTGADMDVCLNSFGTCNFISAKHAVIFYDETSKHFELLNYSEHGTTVDNVLYSCDFSEKTVAVPEPCPIVSAVRGVIKKGRKKKVEKEEKVVVRDRVTMSGGAYKEQKTCSCKGSSSSLIGGSGAGWEGTALLHHGSYIKVGCLQFVFSIVEQAPLETKPLDRRRESRESVSLLKPQFRTQKSDH